MRHRRWGGSITVQPAVGWPVVPHTTRTAIMPLALAGGRREEARMARLLGVAVLAALLSGLVACSQVTDRGSQGMREDIQQKTVPREKAAARERTAVST